MEIQPRFKIQYPMKNRVKDREVFILIYNPNGVFLKW